MYNINLIIFSFTAMQGSVEKSEGHDHHLVNQRHRDLITYDHQILDGEMFLQVSKKFSFFKP